MEETLYQLMVAKQINESKKIVIDVSVAKTIPTINPQQNYKYFRSSEQVITYVNKVVIPYLHHRGLDFALQSSSDVGEDVMTALENIAKTSWIN